MGYRFSLQTANTIANLSFGRVTACYHDITTSEKSFYEFKYFLENFRENLYTTRMETYSAAFEELCYSFRQYKFRSSNDELDLCNQEATQDNAESNRNLLHSILQFSNILSKYKIKSVLLPGKEGYLSREMTSPVLLRKLLRTPSKNSGLILQPEEPIDSPAILNAFPNFDVALRQMDLWPAVQFWNNENKSVFIPISNLNELFFIFEIAFNARDPISQLKLYAIEKANPQHYLLHLSDLHIGNSKIINGLQRIKSLINKQIRAVQQQNGALSVVITGDAVDSPKDNNQARYVDFSDYLENRIGEYPIRLLGNHDINNNGIALNHYNQHIASLVSDFPRIETLEESKVILLLFNSNTNGNFAQGEIGQQQMAQMGNLLDKIDNIESYNLIAVLHHHIVPIPEPDEYEKRLFGKRIEKFLQLKDADIFIKWLRARNVKAVLHGHKHIPFITEKNGINIIACGSSTGQVKLKEEGKTYISYNLLKLNKHGITCTQFVEDILGAGERNIRTKVIKF